jgi:hypothetical protein
MSAIFIDFVSVKAQRNIDRDANAKRSVLQSDPFERPVRSLRSMSGERKSYAHPRRAAPLVALDDLARPSYRKDKVMEVPSMLQGESLKRLLQGIAIGVALTVIVGFNWFSYGFGWTLGGTAEKMALQRVDAALVAAYTPVCVEKFVGPADDAKWEEFAKVESWHRDDYVKKAATFPDATEPSNSVAQACAGVLTKLLDARGPKK